MANSRSQLRIGAVMIVAAAAAWWLAVPLQLGGRTAYVTTHGISMAPHFHDGDVAILRASHRYQVGEVVAYRSHRLKTTVMHRVVGVESGRYTFKGDNNAWLDPEQPTAADLIGRLSLRVPQGGTWLERLTSPSALSALAFLLFASGGAAAQTRRSRRRKTMSRHATRPGWPAPLRAGALVVATMGVLGSGVAALAWTRPVTTSALATASASMRFSYTAAVGHSPAYDTTSASSPDPVFRKLAQAVDVRYAYTGTPGSVSVSALLSTASGWHSTVPLAPVRPFAGSQHEGVVRLDLRGLEGRAEAAAAATGIPAGPVKVVLTPRVQSVDGTSFQPGLTLTLTPLQLALADNLPLTVVSKDVLPNASKIPSMLGLHGREVTVATARTGSVLLVLASLFAAAGLLLLTRRANGLAETEAIRRRYQPLLARVHPMPSTSGQPIIDVTEFATLARIAERDAHPVLHWSRSNVETYIVQDGGSTYRYRTGHQSSPAPQADPLPR